MKSQRGRIESYWKRKFGFSQGGDNEATVGHPGNDLLACQSQTNTVDAAVPIGVNDGEEVAGVTGAHALSGQTVTTAAEGLEQAGPGSTIKTTARRTIAPVVLGSPLSPRAARITTTTGNKKRRVSTSPETIGETQCLTSIVEPQETTQSSQYHHQQHY